VADYASAMPHADVVTLLDDPYDDLDEFDREVVDDVRQYGFHQIHVGQSMADAEERPEWRDVPNWTYTIGFYASGGHPEIVIFSLDHETAASVTWDLFDAVRSGRQFEPYVIYDDALPSFIDQVCSFEPVAPEWAPSLFGIARRFYKRHGFPILQYVWPDGQGRLPWDADASPDDRETHPLLIDPPADEDAPPPKRL
jgi:hypothetical protein